MLDFRRLMISLQSGSIKSDCDDYIEKYNTSSNNTGINNIYRIRYVSTSSGNGWPSGYVAFEKINGSNLDAGIYTVVFVSSSGYVAAQHMDTTGSSTYFTVAGVSSTASIMSSSFMYYCYSNGVYTETNNALKRSGSSYVYTSDAFAGILNSPASPSIKNGFSVYIIYHPLADFVSLFSEFA